MAALLDREISAQLGEVTLNEIIYTIGEQENINFVADTSVPALQQKLYINVEKIRLKEFLDYLSRNMNVTFQVQDDLIGILDGTDDKNLLEETRIFRFAGRVCHAGPVRR